MARAGRHRAAGHGGRPVPDGPRDAHRAPPASTPRPRNVDEVIELVGPAEKANSRIAKLSGGQKRRLDVAYGIVGNPKMLFLDEPTTGFDPSARRGAWKLVSDLRGLGTTILLTTHYMDEAQALADHIVVIGAGKVVGQGTPDDLGGRDVAALLIRFRLPAGVDPASLPVDVTIDQHGYCELTTTDDVRVLHALTGWSLDHDIPLEGLVASRPSLEDIYLALVRGESERRRRACRNRRSFSMTDVALVATQLRYEQKSYWRNPAAAFFTFAFPLVLFFILVADRRDARRDKDLGGAKLAQYYTPSILSFAVMSACFLNIAMNLVRQREDGVLKRMRGTPLPAWALIGGIIGSAVVDRGAALTRHDRVCHYGVWGFAPRVTRAAGHRDDRRWRRSCSARWAWPSRRSSLTSTPARRSSTCRSS